MITADELATALEAAARDRSRGRYPEGWREIAETLLATGLFTQPLLPWTGAMTGDPVERVVALLRELAQAPDMPMHHAADIDQFLVEAMGITGEQP